MDTFIYVLENNLVCVNNITGSNIKLKIANLPTIYMYTCHIEDPFRMPGTPF
jgi:hypothetical protein